MPRARRTDRVAAWPACVATLGFLATASGKATTYVSPSVARSAVAPPRPAAPVPPQMSRTDERIACPVPEEGIAHAVELMREGAMFRYTFPDGGESPVTTAERALADYTGHKYCVALNSGATALYLSIRAAGVEPGSKVLCNAFTFGAVPSAIVHAGCEVVYVESKEDYTIDVDDLKAVIKEQPDCKALMLSHMRGRVGEMDAIAEICKEAGVVLLEDCAHSLGVLYNGKHTGHHGVACGVSAQSFKMLNSGEGGFLLTDDPEIAIRAAIYAGAYEKNAAKHGTKNLPAEEPHHAKLAVELPNLSVRMSALHAAVLIPQMSTLDERIAEYEVRYDNLAEKIRSSPAANAALYIPDDLPEVRAVHDELLFTIRPEAIERAAGGQVDAESLREVVARFQDACAERGLVMNLFGSQINARNFKNWRYAPHEVHSKPLEQTTELIRASFGIRLPMQWQRAEIMEIADVLEYCAGEVFGQEA